MYYIGVDLGTSSVKLLLMDKQGTVVKTVSKEYPISFPKPGWSEQNPYDWYEQSVAGIRELTVGIKKEEVAGISFGGQMHGLVILDENDKVIRPAILWNDGRTTKECEYLNNTIGKGKLTEYTANIAFAGFTAPKILWVRENEPENFQKIRKIMLPKDYLAYRFSGVHATDVSDASGMLLFDVKNRRWSEEMLEICGISKDCMARVFESYECIGHLTEEAAEKLGLTTDTAVIAGAGDNAAAAVGTGTVGDGSCNISLGTSGTIFISSMTFGVDANNALHAFAHADGHYHLMGCMLSAASCNKWWLDDIIGTGDYAKEQEGITDEMTQAVLEGVAFAIRDSFEVAKSLGMKITETKICGGGAKSPLWRKMIANILNIRVCVLDKEEGPSLGAAMLAAVGTGAYETVEAAAGQIVHVVDTIEPDAKIAARYEEKYRQFQQIYPALKPVFDSIAKCESSLNLR